MNLLFVFLLQTILSETTKGFWYEEVDYTDERFYDNFRLAMSFFPGNFQYKASVFSCRSYSGQTSDSSLNYVFERNPHGFWQARVPNSQYLPVIEQTFEDPYEIDKVAYSPRRIDGKAVGYPVIASFYINYGDNNFRFIGRIESNASRNAVIFHFNQTYKAKAFRIEFTKLNSGDYATSSMLMAFRPFTTEIIQAFDLFEQYNYITLKPKYRNKQLIENIIAKTKHFPFYKQNIEFRAERALKILANQVFYDKNREFSTDPATLANYLRQIGDMDAYGKNNLNMTSPAINYIPTGIYSGAGDPVRVYITSDLGESLPSFKFTQHLGLANDWIDKKNSYIRHPRRGVGLYTTPKYHEYPGALPGGPIYLINPYNSSQQSRNVKVYIEGGRPFPTFKSGGNIEQYKKELASYTKNNSNLDVTELISNNSILTLSAKKASTFFNEQNLSPQNSLNKLDSLLNALYKREGVVLNEKDKSFDPRNKYLNMNFRLVQQEGTQQIGSRGLVGLTKDELQDGLLSGKEIDFQIIQAMYNNIDYQPLAVPGMTNYVAANIFYSDYYNKESQLNHERFTNQISDDRYQTPGATHNLDYPTVSTLWFNLESHYPGFWLSIKKLFKDNLNDGLTQAERFVYYSSLVTKKNLSYFYARLGKDFLSQQFDYTKASQSFKNKMGDLKKNNKDFDADPRKYWYVGRDTYSLYKKASGKLGLYQVNQQFSDSVNISLGPLGYTFSFPDKRKIQLHQGFEVQVKNGSEFVPILFSNDILAIDTWKYPLHQKPTYRFVAYDKSLARTSPSREINVHRKVLVYNGKEYESIRDILGLLKSQDTVYIKDDIYEHEININMYVTFTVHESVKKNITFHVPGYSTVFNVGAGATLRLLGNPKFGFAFEGSDINGNRYAINSNGNVELEYVTFKNIISTKNYGAALYSNISGKVKVNHCSFENNQAQLGGPAIYTEKSETGTLNVQNSQFSGNRIGMLVDGNAIRGGSVTSNVYTEIGSSTFNNNIGLNGGALSLYHLSKVYDSVFTGNQAIMRGGAVDVRNLTTFYNTKFEKNKAPRGSAIYVRIPLTEAKKSISLTNVAFAGNEGERGSSLYSKNANVYIENNNAVSVINGEFYLTPGCKPLSYKGDNSKVQAKLYADYGDGQIIVTTSQSLSSDQTSFTLSEKLTNKYSTSVSADGKSVFIGRTSNKVDNTVDDAFFDTIDDNHTAKDDEHTKGPSNNSSGKDPQQDSTILTGDVRKYIIIGGVSAGLIILIAAIVAVVIIVKSRYGEYYYEYEYYSSYIA